MCDWIGLGLVVIRLRMCAWFSLELVVDQVEDV